MGKMHPYLMCAACFKNNPDVGVFIAEDNRFIHSVSEKPVFAYFALDYAVAYPSDRRDYFAAIGYFPAYNGIVNLVGVVVFGKLQVSGCKLIFCH